MKKRSTILILLITLLVYYIAVPGSSQSNEYCDSMGGWVAIGPTGSVFVCPFTTGVEACSYKCNLNYQ
ncbi:MAG TPA: hypothetical protein PKC76_10570 [Saprospiraceae bacterium]|nr:hypothetical protein [Saprospiraceae bacterium]HMP24567.1 hypothetical protein [Saprospiraceae bacterium]